MIDPMLSYLEDFSQDNSFANGTVLPDEKTFNAGNNVNLIPIDIQLEKDQSYQQGYADSVSEQESYWKSHIESLKKTHCNEIADFHKKFEYCTSDFISAAVKDSIKLFADYLEHEVARILVPMLEIEMSRNSARALAECVVDVFKKGECGAIKIHGPKSLHSFIEQHLGEYSSLVCYEVSDQIDFSTEISGSIVTTRLESCFSNVKKILEEKKVL